MVRLYYGKFKNFRIGFHIKSNCHSKYEYCSKHSLHYPFCKASQTLFYVNLLHCVQRAFELRTQQIVCLHSRLDDVNGVSREPEQQFRDAAQRHQHC